MIACGNNDQGALLDEVYIWNSYHDSWVKSLISYPKSVRGVEGFVIENKAMFIGGLTENYTRVLAVYQLNFSSVLFEEELVIWPNPVRYDASVSFKLRDDCVGCQLEVFDLNANLIEIKKDHTIGEFIKFRTIGLDNGVYYIRPATNKRIFSSKLIVIK